MLNPFPELLAYSFFAPTLLRILLGGCLLWAAWMHLSAAQRTPNTKILWYSGALELIIAILLIIGLWTQIAAIAATIISLTYFFIHRNLSAQTALPQATYLLLTGISLSLLVTGAGAFAFDIPL